ncbi:MAG: hypothetical protein AB7E85_00735 [Pseudobdellovibrionaceae bacterium]
MLLELEEFIQSVRLNSDGADLNGSFLHAARALNLKSRKLSDAEHAHVLADYECLSFVDGNLSYVIEDDSIIGILQKGTHGCLPLYMDVPSGMLDAHLPIFRQAAH